MKLNPKMEWRSPKHWAFIACVFLSALLLGIVAGTKGVASSETAAWVQALGSVGAIAGAAWIANWQTAEAKESERARREEMWILFYELISNFITQLKTTQGLCEIGGAVLLNKYAILAVSSANNAVIAFPKEQLSHSPRFGSAIRIQGAVQDATNFINSQNDKLISITDASVAEASVKNIGIQIGIEIKEITESLEDLKRIKLAP